MSDPIAVLEPFPTLSAFCRGVLALRPKHAPMIANSLKVHTHADLEQLEQLAHLIDVISTDRTTMIASYNWMCERFFEQEIHFRRTGEYQCKSLQQAILEVYSDKPFMEKYMQGLLVSQLFWCNHAKSYLFFKNEFLPRLKRPYDYLEIGPGHGLFLALAASDPCSHQLVAVDVSAESLDQTAASLRKQGVDHKVQLISRDIVAGPVDGIFDAITISEVLEHMDEPNRALGNLRKSLAKDGLILVNFPINSPAPDHIFLLSHPDQVRTLIEKSGFEILEFANFPMGGLSVERALAIRATISCVAIARPSP